MEFAGDAPKSILVFYDGSDSAEAGLAFALRLAGDSRAKLAVAHVITPEAGFLEGLPSTELEAERWLDVAVKREAPDPPPEFEALVVEAYAASEAVVTLSAERDPELAIVGKTGKGGFRRYMLGSSAERLIEHAHHSVAAFPEHPASRSISTVIVGYDGSDPSREALSQGAAVATTLSLPLEVVHVADPELPYPMSAPAREAYMDAAQRGGEGLLEEARASLGDDGATVELLSGDSRKALIDLAEERETALIVLGHRGAGGFAGMRLGGTAREVARRAQAPVLIAKPN